MLHVSVAIVKVLNMSDIPFDVLFMKTSTRSFVHGSNLVFLHPSLLCEEAWIKETDLTLLVLKFSLQS